MDATAAEPTAAPPLTPPEAASSTSSAADTASEADEPPAPRWFERPCKWDTVASVEALNALLGDSGGKYIAVDFFAG